eukprot:Hpha_TRINITY_DN19072_c0_g1::TRINITY_DN19072_c0_g1_i1::g.138383::m.138383
MKKMRTCMLLVLVGSAAGTGFSEGDHSPEYLLGRIRSSRPRDTTDEIDCLWRQLAWRYHNKLQPWLSTALHKQVFDALELQQLCNQSFTPPPPSSAGAAESRRGAVQDRDVPTFFVDPVSGDDAADGSEPHPFLTVERAVSATRGRALGSAAKVLLRGGRHELRRTIMLTAEDSGLLIQGFPDEEVEVSGGLNLTGLKWEPVAGREGVYRCSLAQYQAALGDRGVPALRHRGKRVTLARYPNANPELTLFPKGYVTNFTAWGLPKYEGTVCEQGKQCGVSQNLTIPQSVAWKGMYQNFTLGVGGSCSRYDPPHSPWCSGDFYPLRQFAGDQLHTRTPASVQFVGNLPNAPYKRPQDTVVHAWRPGHWFTWMFSVGEQTGSSKVDTWTVHHNTSTINGLIYGPRPKADGAQGMKYLGQFDNSTACWAYCNSTGQCAGWAYYEKGADPAYVKGCYGLTEPAGWRNIPEPFVTSGRGPHVEG